MNAINQMTHEPLISFFLISGIIFLLLAVAGKSKFAFVEINPGGWGRFLALIIGSVCLILGVGLVILPWEIFSEVIRNFVVEQLKNNINFSTGRI
jgi:hypothetical protein